jgi:hypothetical protein
LKITNTTKLELPFIVGPKTVNALKLSNDLPKVRITPTDPIIDVKT